MRFASHVVQRSLFIERVTFNWSLKGISCSSTHKWVFNGKEKHLYLMQSYKGHNFLPGFLSLLTKCQFCLNLHILFISKLSAIRRISSLHSQYFFMLRKRVLPTIICISSNTLSSRGFGWRSPEFWTAFRFGLLDSISFKWLNLWNTVHKTCRGFSKYRIYVLLVHTTWFEALFCFYFILSFIIKSFLSVKSFLSKVHLRLHSVAIQCDCFFFQVILLLNF